MTVNTQKVDRNALTLLKIFKKNLTKQQYRTIRGQILSGDADGARKDMYKLLNILN